MRTLHDSELAVAIYPTFTYNALGGGGLAKATQDGDIVHLTFDPATLNIPDVNYRNTTFMGMVWVLMPKHSRPRGPQRSISFEHSGQMR